MDEFKLNKLELLLLCRNIYEEACCGYLDLKDSVCERVVADFLDKKEPEKEAKVVYEPASTHRSVSSTGTIWTTNPTYTGTGDVASTIYTTSDFTTSNNFTIANNDVTLHSNEIVLRSDTDLREIF